MENSRPAPLNVVTDDPTGNKWGLPEGVIVRYGKGYTGHQVRNRIALSPDYKYFAVGTRLGLWWYDISTLTPIGLWETRRGNIHAIDISSDGKMIAIANWDGIIKIFDIQSGTCITQIHRVTEQKLYSHVVFSPDGKWVATANTGGMIENLDIHSGNCIAQMDWGTDDHLNHISQLRFSPDGKHLAATAGIQTYLWNPDTGVKTTKLESSNCTFTSDSSHLVCENRYVVPNTTPPRGAVSISVWDIETWERVRTISEEHYLAGSKAISPCSQYLAISDFNSIVQIWDLKTGMLQESYNDYSKYVIKLYYLDDETLLAIELMDETIEVWNVKRREKLQTYEKQDGRIGYNWFNSRAELFIAHTLSKNNITSEKRHTFSTLQEPLCFPTSISFSPDGCTLAITGDQRGITLWDNKKEHIQEILIRDKSIDAFAYSPSGNIIAIGSTRNFGEDGVIYSVWDISDTTEDSIAEFTSMELGRHTFAITDDRIAFGGKDGTLFLWHPKESPEPKKLMGHTKHIWTLAFSPDGKRLSSGSSDKTVRIWDVEAGEEIDILSQDNSETTKALAFSPDGSMIAGGMFGCIHLWCAEKHIPLHILPHTEDGEKPYALTFSPCGRFLASGTWWQKGMEKMTICLWQVETGEKITTFWGHTSDIQTLSFSPDGTLLASGSFDGTTLLWDLKSIAS